MKKNLNFKKNFNCLNFYVQSANKYLKNFFLISFTLNQMFYMINVLYKRNLS